jgi:spoIIIJ-associated protein
VTDLTTDSTSDSASDAAPDAVPDLATDVVADVAADAGTDTDTDQDANGAARPARPEPDVTTLEQEGDVAADYLEALLDIADLDGDIDMDVEGTRAIVSLVGGDLSRLVGPNGVVLEALQELTRLAVLRETGNRSRLMLDVDGFRARRRDTLTQQGREAAAKVKETGESVRMAPMTPFERKVVHDAVAAEGLRSESEGEEPHRRVVVLPA